MRISTISSRHAALLAAALLLIPTGLWARSGAGAGSKRVSKITTNNVYVPMDINNVFNYYSNNGDGSFDKFSRSNEGFEFPIGSNDGTCIFEDGLVWTAIKNHKLYCGGSTYNHGLQAGPILTDGTSTTPPTAANSSDPAYRVYRVRLDMRPTSNADTIAMETSLLQSGEVKYIDRYQSLTAAQILQQYWTDWNDWPAAEGAPYTDINHDGKYEPGVDIPGVPGADQTEWMVMNDANSIFTFGLYGSTSIGLEIQRTIWAYKTNGALGNTIFIKYKLINKSGVKLDSMYVSQWADPDVGYAGDDAAGCDTLLNLGYAYNGAPTDPDYANLDSPPPAVGFELLQGPIVPGTAGDTAVFGTNKIVGSRNLPMTAFAFFANNDTTYADPNLGDTSGTYQWYNLMRGRVSGTGSHFINPQTKQPTKFVFPGDPVTNSGWTYLNDGSVSPGDIRIALCSGPFTMAAGDTQEVVLAAIAGFGKDHLRSVYTLKRYAYDAAYAYRHMFKGATPPSPPVPISSVTNYNGQIQINWQSNAESFSQDGYLFEGYNVYQMSSPLGSKNASKLIATFDKNDLITSLYADELDPATDKVSKQQQQFGTDSGLRYAFTASSDYINNVPFIKGKKYYFAVTAYSYNPATNADPNNTESKFVPDTVVFDRTLPGANSGDQLQAVHTAGQSEAKVTVTVVDPSKLTGHQYQVSFHKETYSLGASGEWTDITAASKAKRLDKTEDLTGSSLSSYANWGETKGQINIHTIADVMSTDFSYCDGINLVFPPNAVIVKASEPISNNSGSRIPYYINTADNSIFFGNRAVMSGDTSSRDGNGLFAGNEDMVVTVRTTTLPVYIHYTMYDDNFGPLNGYGGKLVDVSGVDTVTTIANEILSQKQWNVTDFTNETVALRNQTIINGEDIYAPEFFFAQNGINGPGGSSGSPYADVGTSGDHTFDGIRVDISGTYDPPTTIGNVIIDGDSAGRGGLGTNDFVSYAKGDTLDLTDFTVFGYNGTAATSLPLFGGVAGTKDPNALEQSYELKWTGVEGDTTINGHTVVITKSGGSIATLFGASNYSLANHPLNPNPGSNSPFTIRIPFEVWNIDKNEQVNLLVWDRNDADANVPGRNGFQVWETGHRMYGWVVNTSYSPAVINPNSVAVADAATWNWTFFKSEFTTGEDMKILYNTPITMGSDVFSFTAPSPVLGVSGDRQNVIKSYSLSQNYPNPFNPSTVIDYQLPARSHVTLTIYDVLGREVTRLVDGDEGTGSYHVTFRGSRFASGVYFCRIQAVGLTPGSKSFSRVRKMMLLK